MAKAIAIDDDAHFKILKISTNRRLYGHKSSKLPKSITKIVSELIRELYKEEIE